MVIKKIFSQDLQIAKSLIVRDEMVTRKYFYQQCYPLFKSIFDNYYTDCANVREFIDEMYYLHWQFLYLPAVVVKMPGKGIFRVVNWMAKRICRFRCKVTQLLQEQ